jgi:hypothetical protein
MNRITVTTIVTHNKTGAIAMTTETMDFKNIEEFENYKDIMNKPSVSFAGLSSDYSVFRTIEGVRNE